MPLSDEVFSDLSDLSEEDMFVVTLIYEIDSKFPGNTYDVFDLFCRTDYIGVPGYTTRENGYYGQKIIEHGTLLGFDESNPPAFPQTIELEVGFTTADDDYDEVEVTLTLKKLCILSKFGHEMYKI